MLHFKKVRFRNFISYGNYTTEVDLDKHKMSLITAKNGSGKSAFMDAIVFALFGRPYRKINKPNLVNSINGKGLLTEIEFAVNENQKSTQYKVVRGIKPSVFEIYVNGNKIDEKDNARDQQKYLEENILKTNYRTFIQIVILGSANYIPFMHLTPAQRREFIENLLDIDIFSTMNSVLKQRNAILKDLKQRNQLKMMSVDERIEQQQKLIGKLETQKENEESNIQNEIELHNKRIEKQREVIKNLQSQIAKIDSEKKELNEYSLKKQKNTGSTLIAEANSVISKIRKDMKFMEQHTNCPTCKQDIDDSHKEHFIEEAQKEIESKQEIHDEAQEKYDAIIEKLNKLQKLNNDYFELMTKVESARENIANIQEDIKRLEERKIGVNREDIEKEQLQLKKIQLGKEKYEEQDEFLKNKEELYGVAFDLLKDSGIKSRIISQYVPIINKLINQYLSEMNFPVTFTLDETFNEKILSRYRDSFTYDNFSQGEKMRIDIALLMVWRNVAEMKNSIHTNLLLMDEVFDSSLDSDGMEDFLKILKGVSRNNNIYIISHTIEQGSEKFDRNIVVEKVNDFSYLEA